MNNSAVISDLRDEQSISNEFAKSFNENFIDSNTNVNSKLKFLSLYEQKLSSDDNIFYQSFMVEEINSALIKLKFDKAPGYDSVTPEHVKYAGYALSSVLFKGQI